MTLSILHAGVQIGRPLWALGRSVDRLRRVDLTRASARVGCGMWGWPLTERLGSLVRGLDAEPVSRPAVLPVVVGLSSAGWQLTPSGHSPRQNLRSRTGPLPLYPRPRPLGRRWQFGHASSDRRGHGPVTEHGRTPREARPDRPGEQIRTRHTVRLSGGVGSYPPAARCSLPSFELFLPS